MIQIWFSKKGALLAVPMQVKDETQRMTVRARALFDKPLQRVFESGKHTVYDYGSVC
jgi:hypothetical protein